MVFLYKENYKKIAGGGILILEGIINVVMALFTTIITAINPILGGLDIPNDVVTTIKDIIESVAYFVPVADLAIMLGISLMVNYWHVMWRIIQRVWDALPFT